MIKTEHLLFEGKFVDDPQNHSLKMKLETEDGENLQQGEYYLIELKRKMGMSRIVDKYVFVKRIRVSGSNYEFSIPRDEVENVAKGVGYIVEVKGPVDHYDTGWNRIVVKL